MVFQRPVRRRRWLDDIGWRWSLLGLIPVAAVLAIGIYRSNPAVSPAPEDYREATCGAYRHLGEALEHLERGVELAQARDTRVTEAGRDARRSVTTAHGSLEDLPRWAPGDRLETQFATLLRHADEASALLAGESGPVYQQTAQVAASVELARDVHDQIATSFQQDEYGFTCAAGG